MNKWGKCSSHCLQEGEQHIYTSCHHTFNWLLVLHIPFFLYGPIISNVIRGGGCNIPKTRECKQCRFNVMTYVIKYGLVCCCDVTFVLIRYCIFWLTDSFAVETTHRDCTTDSQSVRGYSGDILMCNDRDSGNLVQWVSSQCHLDFTCNTFPQSNSPPSDTGVW